MVPITPIMPKAPGGWVRAKEKAILLMLGVVSTPLCPAPASREPPRCPTAGVGSDSAMKKGRRSPDPVSPVLHEVLITAEMGGMILLWGSSPRAGPDLRTLLLPRPRGGRGDFIPAAIWWRGI